MPTVLTERAASSLVTPRKTMPLEKPFDPTLDVLLDIDDEALVDGANLPANEIFDEWIALALVDACDVTSSSATRPVHEVSIRLVGRTEMQALNRIWRQKDAPTNVLSFPSGLPPLPRAGKPALLALGDLVFCPSVVEAEAHAQQKRLAHHWAHLVVHGTLHLLGHDHQTEAEAVAMEAVEIRLLSSRLIPDPYGVRAHLHD